MVNVVIKSLICVCVKIRTVSAIHYGKTALPGRSDRPRQPSLLSDSGVARRLSGQCQAHEPGFCQASHFCQALQCLELKICDLDRHQSGSPLPLSGRQLRLRFVEFPALQLQIICCLPERVGVQIDDPLESCHWIDCTTNSVMRHAPKEHARFISLSPGLLHRYSPPPPVVVALPQPL